MTPSLESLKKKYIQTIQRGILSTEEYYHTFLRYGSILFDNTFINQVLMYAQLYNKADYDNMIATDSFNSSILDNKDVYIINKQGIALYDSSKKLDDRFKYEFDTSVLEKNLRTKHNLRLPNMEKIIKGIAISSVNTIEFTEKEKLFISKSIAQQAFYALNIDTKLDLSEVTSYSSNAPQYVKLANAISEKSTKMLLDLERDIQILSKEQANAQQNFATMLGIPTNISNTVQSQPKPPKVTQNTINKNQISLVQNSDKSEQEAHKDITEEVITTLLKQGSGFEQGKYRIYNHYKVVSSNADINDNIHFLKREYGVGGAYPAILGTNIHQWHDSKGIFISNSIIKTDDTEQVLLSWSEVNKGISNLVSQGNYLSSEELEKYPAYLQDIEQTNLNENDTDEIRTMFRKSRDIYKDNEGSLVFMQRNSFYEIYKEGVDIVSKELGIAVTSIKLSLFTTVPMTAFPDFMLEENVSKLNSAGFDVVVVSEDNEITKYPHSQTPDRSQTSDPVGPISNEDIQFTYGADTDVDYGSIKTKIQNNITAINLLTELDNKKSRATLSEQETLSKYVGWGGIPHVFDKQNNEFKEHYDTLREILSDTDYKSARASTLSAFYTDPNIISNIYTTLQSMGFHGGTVLEPSMGTGNFLSAMPSSMYHNSHIYGVELDSISGRIAKYLHPGADIQIQGFEKTNFNNNSFDLVVGNIPFGDFTLSDNTLDLPKNFLIHDFFFAKALQKVKPNGIVAFITSSGTLDKKDNTVRKYIHDRADFLGAVRLPNTAFKNIANTDVVSDIIFLQKRELELEVANDIDHPFANTYPNWVNLATNDDGFTVNSYFVDNPHMVLGKFKHDTGQFGRAIIDVVNDRDFDLNSALKESLSNIDSVRDIYDIQTNAVYMVEEDTDTRYKDNSFVVVNDELYFYNKSLIPQTHLKKTEITRGKLLCELRDTYRTMITMQEGGILDTELFKKQLVKLNETYDSIVNSKNPTFLNSRGCNFFSCDNDYFLLRSLENKYEYTKEEKLVATKKLPDKYIKSKAFFGPMIAPPQRLVITSAQQALTASIYKRGGVDLEYMSEIYNHSIDKVISELGDKIIQNPENNFKYETSQEYLSGNVKEKLEYVNKMVSEYPQLEQNIKALTAVLPKDLTIEDIQFSLSSMWIPLELKQEFMYELFDVSKYNRMDNPNGYNKPKHSVYISYDKHSTTHTIINKPLASLNLNAKNTYGTDRKNGLYIFEETLNLATSSVYDTFETDGKKRRVFNATQSQLARNKQELMNAEFINYVTRDINRIKTIEKIYNENFNNTVTRTYDGSDVIIDNMTESISLRPHQKDSISRILLGGNTLLAHEVGSGKTFTMVASAMVLKQTGISKKSMIVVPNHLTEQWGHDFLQLFPTANILVATKKDFEKDNRQIFINKIASGDYDAVILTFTQFERIPLSPEFQETQIKEQLDELVDSLSELDYNEDKITVKQLEKHKKRLEEKLDKLLQIDNKDNTLFFERLGVDTLFVDEAHNYKNCFVATKLNNVAGIGKTSANKSEDLLMKTRYFHQKNNWNGGVVFATGTPITNSISELFVMQRYLQPQTLIQNGLAHFDAWASAFGNITEKAELAPEGKSFRPKMRFENFINLPELMRMFHEVADIKVIEDLDIERPELKGDKVAIVESRPSKIVTDYIDYLAERADSIRKGSVDPSEDNMR